MYVVSHDITDVKQAQEQLAAREEELRFFAENIPEAIAYVDLERGCTFVNNLFLASRGFTREFALGHVSRPGRLSARGAEALRPHLERVQRGEETSYERFLDLPRGRASAGCACASRRGAMPTARCAATTRSPPTSTTSRRAQEQLDDKERQLRQVIDSIPTPMCYVDADDRYRYVNDAFLAYIGLTSEQHRRAIPCARCWATSAGRLLSPHLRARARRRSRSPSSASCASPTGASAG